PSPVWSCPAENPGATAGLPTCGMPLCGPDFRPERRTRHPLRPSETASPWENGTPIASCAVFSAKACQIPYGPCHCRGRFPRTRPARSAIGCNDCRLVLLWHVRRGAMGWIGRQPQPPKARRAIELKSVSLSSERVASVAPESRLYYILSCSVPLGAVLRMEGGSLIPGRRPRPTRLSV